MDISKRTLLKSMPPLGAAAAATALPVPFLSKQAKAQQTDNGVTAAHIRGLFGGVGISPSLPATGLPTVAACVSNTGEVTDNVENLETVYWHVGDGRFLSEEIGPMLLARFFMKDDPQIMRIRVFQLDLYGYDDYTEARYSDFVGTNYVPAIDLAVVYPFIFFPDEFYRTGLAVNYGNLYDSGYIGEMINTSTWTPKLSPDNQHIIENLAPPDADVYREGDDSFDTMNARYVAYRAGSANNVIIQLYYPSVDNYYPIIVDLNGDLGAFGRGWMDTIDAIAEENRNFAILLEGEAIATALAAAAGLATGFVSLGLSTLLLAFVFNAEVYQHAKKVEQLRQKLLTFWFAILTSNGPKIEFETPISVLDQTVLDQKGYASLEAYFLDESGISDKYTDGL